MMESKEVGERMAQQMNVVIIGRNYNNVIRSAAF